MTEQHIPGKLNRTAAQSFTANLDAALKVGGMENQDNGLPQPLAAAFLQRETGVARTTLRALRAPKSGEEVNPDLRTICRLAEALGIPPAFLLMRPQDWNALGQTLAALPDYAGGAIDAHNELPGQAHLNFANSLTNVVLETLRHLKIHGERPPPGASHGATADNDARRAREEYRRKSSFQWKALISQEGIDQNYAVAFTALTAGMVNVLTPKALVANK